MHLDVLWKSSSLGWEFELNIKKQLGDLFGCYILTYKTKINLRLHPDDHLDEQTNLTRLHNIYVDCSLLRSFVWNSIFLLFVKQHIFHDVDRSLSFSTPKEQHNVTCLHICIVSCHQLWIHWCLLQLQFTNKFMTHLLLIEALIGY